MLLRYIFVLSVNVIVAAAQSYGKLNIYVKHLFKNGLPENTPPGEVVAVVTVKSLTDGYAGKVTCKVVGNRSDEFFIMRTRKNNFNLTAIRSFDYEQTGYIFLLIDCWNDNIPVERSVKRLRVAISDQNEFPPRFKDKGRVIYVKENSRIGTRVGVVSVADSDANQTNNVRLSLDSESSRFFRIYTTGSKGTIVLKRPLDREQIQKLQLLVFATDSGSPAFTSTATLQVVVADENDNRPEFLNTTDGFYRFNVSRDAPIGTFIGQISAVDKDFAQNGFVRYRLDQYTPKFFSLNQDNGRMILKSRLDKDRNRTSIYEFTATAFDHGTTRRGSSVKIEVHVQDSRVAPPCNTISFPQSRYNISVPRSGRDDLVVASVSARMCNQPSSKITYSVVGGNGVSVDPKSGQIRVTRRKNLPSTFNVTVVAVSISEGGSYRSAGVPVTIMVTGKVWNQYEIRNRKALRNVECGIISFHYLFSVRENEKAGTALGRVMASGATQISYRLDQPSPTLRVNKDTGVISTTSVLDREKTALIRATIVAVGRNRTLVSASTSVMVEVLDANDCRPKFRENVTISVKEGGHESFYLPQTRASDCDASSPNNNIFYKVLPSRFSKLFQISDRGGAILKAGTLDYEEATKFSVVLVATDGGKPARSSSISITVKVIDVNEFAPRWLFPSYKMMAIRVPVSFPAGSIVAVVKASDKDPGPKGIFYYITGATSMFNISLQDGDISTGRAFSNRDIGTHIIQLRATDSGSPSLTTVTNLNVMVVNDGSF